jgi:hypothetical protein
MITRQHIANSDFSSKSSWNETCSMSSCATVASYGPNLSSVYFINCCSSPYYYSVSQTLSTVPYATYNISFAVTLYKGTSNATNANVYVN